MDFLKELNEQQHAAVTSTEGPHMIIAGAGSGKTRVLTYRLAYIMDQGLADPFQLLALTFTNKAAREMKERIEHLVGPEAKNIWMGTFHSIFARILRREAELLGYTSNFTIYDTDDSESMLRKIVRELNLDDKKFKPRALYNHISSAKNALVDPEDYALNYTTDSFTNVVARIYKIYCTRLFDSNAMDFDDLLVKPVELFEKHPDRLLFYQHKFKYIMVDEYQDTNHAQYMITKKLAASHENICVVGDDAQSIYSFRGANIQNILNFRKDYPDAGTFKLERNYRSTQTIVNAANAVIEKNQNQIQKRVYSEKEEGDLIRLMENSTEQEEGRNIADAIREQMMRHQYTHKDFAVLYRTNAQSRAVETELRRFNVRYKVFGGLSFYKRKEIKDMVAYFKLAVNPRDEAALTRVINYPARGIGQTSLDRLSVFADEHNLSLWESLQHVGNSGLNSRAVNAVNGFVTTVKSFAIKARDMNAYEAASHIAKASGMLKFLHQAEDLELMARWENVQELLNAAKEFTEDPDQDAHTLDAFLAEISLFTDQDEKDENPDYVTLMTIHAAKGLEFPSVFIVGMEEDLFPNFMALQSRADLEEERRLFYVAVTRAKERLTLSFAKTRYKYGRLEYNEPSRFLEEIDPQFLHMPSRRRKPSQPAGGGNTPQPRVMGRRVTPVASLNRRASTPGTDFQGDDLSGLTPGAHVEHAKFGQGNVVSVEGQGSERKATVDFREKGRKVLLLKYAKLKILT